MLSGVIEERFGLAATYLSQFFKEQTGEMKILLQCFEAGINFFDVTQDSEKEALGKKLDEIPCPYEIYVQSRPEGMVYGYDPFNRKMADYGLLRAEIQRGLEGHRRPRPAPSSCR